MTDESGVMAESGYGGPSSWMAAEGDEYFLPEIGSDIKLRLRPVTHPDAVKLFFSRSIEPLVRCLIRKHESISTTSSSIHPTSQSVIDGVLQSSPRCQRAVTYTPSEFHNLLASSYLLEPQLGNFKHAQGSRVSPPPLCYPPLSSLPPSSDSPPHPEVVCIKSGPVKLQVEIGRPEPDSGGETEGGSRQRETGRSRC
ncbi:unnamed protein product [Pleuronectes platessa]|uniref:Uncharacterized protein n=1 Tax=Pleuronectes platessa TaxID=8262 RepID=A0A9N7TLV7_PLEPL|nr:unnamed protein product [Pleuronectes platessa]